MLGPFYLSHLVFTASSGYFPFLYLFFYSTSKMWQTSQERQANKLTFFVVCVTGTNPERGEKRTESSLIVNVKITYIRPIIS